jgi:hypothetical protein
MVRDRRAMSTIGHRARIFSSILFPLRLDPFFQLLPWPRIDATDVHLRAFAHDIAAVFSILNHFVAFEAKYSNEAMSPSL